MAQSCRAVMTERGWCMCAAINRVLIGRWGYTNRNEKVRDVCSCSAECSKVHMSNPCVHIAGCNLYLLHMETRAWSFDVGVMVVLSAVIGCHHSVSCMLSVSPQFSQSAILSNLNEYCYGFGAVTAAVLK